MSDVKDAEQRLVLDYRLRAPPEKVWRALSIPEFRERWLPAEALAGPEPVSCVPGQELQYRMREDQPPFLESTVTFQIRPGEGGTQLRIIHRLDDAAGAAVQPSAANSNRPALMRAA
ncbi:SRPBCC family protein [Bosea sp. (in: a-proteobacteria)]|jgi:uncharacterized protein YndB with AHSA1/START domain|uniref:SRPBCC family protein n=1 Tax=Bosea sp. (in: a-proteobacteria) TaxID=1871050 RepID=UPI003F6E5E37